MAATDGSVMVINVFRLERRDVAVCASPPLAACVRCFCNDIVAETSVVCVVGGNNRAVSDPEMDWGVAAVGHSKVKNAG